MSTLVLEGRGVGRVYGSGPLAQRALAPSHVQVRRGELALVSGPSGSGKTTLLGILGLVLSPTEGEVFLNGAPVGGLSPAEQARVRLRHLGFVFQQWNLVSGLTAAENVAVPLLLAGVPAPERARRAAECLDAVGLGPLSPRKPREMSGGQQQRVAVARALAGGPDVVLCDEPTASLDAASGQEVLRLLRAAADAGRAVLVVAHDDRVRAVADRVIPMSEGRIEGGVA